MTSPDQTNQDSISQMAGNLYEKTKENMSFLG